MDRQEALNKINNLSSGNDFAKRLLKTIRYADTLNLYLLSFSYPSEVGAHLLYSHGISLEQWITENKFEKEIITFMEKITRKEAIKKMLQLQGGGHFASNLFEIFKVANAIQLGLLSRGFKNEVNAYLLYSKGITLKEFLTDTEPENYEQYAGKPEMKRKEFEQMMSQETAEANRRWNEGY